MSAAATRKRPWLWTFGVLALVFGSCMAFCGYSAWQAQTPEGKREEREQEARKRQEVMDLVAKLGRVRKAVPPAGAPDQPCAAKVAGRSLPVVDTLYLSAVLDESADLAGVAPVQII